MEISTAMANLIVLSGVGNRVKVVKEKNLEIITF